MVAGADEEQRANRQAEGRRLVKKKEAVEKVYNN